MGNECFVVDGHGDIPIDVFLRRVKGERNVLDQYHGKRLRSAGMKIQVMAVYVEARHKPHQSLEMGLRQFGALLDDLDESQEFSLICNKSDLDSVLRSDKVGVIVDMEGAEPIEGGIDLLHTFFRMGLRMLGLTWNQRNKLADGKAEAGFGGGGLTQYGRQVVEECEKKGIMVDVSHLSKAGVDDVLKYSKGKILASHATSTTLNDIPRNLTDGQIREIGNRGGIIGVPAYPRMLSQTVPSIETVVDHIDYLLNTAGRKNVGIGADFVDIFVDLIDEDLMGKEWILPKEQETTGYSSASDIPALLKTMRDRGLSEETITDIAGNNFINFFKSALPD